ncbi:MAG: DNA polymerase III subunit chi [Caenibius sp.]
MRVDFYQLSRDPAELVVPLLARATGQAGERLLVVSSNADELVRIDKALWEKLPEAFLAHGRAGEGHEERQPTLLSQTMQPANGARYVALADGLWRDEADGFDRVFLLFGDNAIDGARVCWKMLGARDGVERRFWKQDGGKWREGP